MDNILIALVSIVTLGVIAYIVELLLDRQCKHDWQVIDKSDICHSSGPNFGQPYGWWYISKCRRCGKLKSEKFK